MQLHREKAAASRPIAGRDQRSADALSLERDGRAVREALTELTRVLQFRDRDCLCAREISVTQCHALDALVTRGRLALNDLAAALYVDKSTASRVIDGLERKGYVQRQPHPADGRSVLVEPTATGRLLCAEIREDLLDDCMQLLTDFEPEIRSALARLLDRLARAAGARVTAAGGSCCRADGA